MKMGKGLEADVIVPVPLHKVRRRERGFNRAEMLSRRLATRLKLPHQGVLLVRKRPRPDKHLLTSNERREAVCRAFPPRPCRQALKLRLLLVDVVMPSVPTAEVRSKALRRAG